MRSMNYSVTVLEKTWLDRETFELRCERPEGFIFQAGQYVTLSYRGVEREYTIISAPESKTLCFLIKCVVGGALSMQLANLPPAATVHISAAKGYLLYRPGERQVFWVANGVGVAPFVAMAAAGVRNFTLIHGVRKVGSLYYRNQLAAAAYQYIPCITGHEDCGHIPGLFRGRVTEYVRTKVRPGSHEFYLCGSRDMIRDMTHLLDDYYPDALVYSEAYT